MVTNVSFSCVACWHSTLRQLFQEAAASFLKNVPVFSTQACASTALVVLGIYALVPNCALGVIYVKDFAIELKVICIMLPIKKFIWLHEVVVRRLIIDS